MGGCRLTIRPPATATWRVGAYLVGMDPKGDVAGPHFVFRIDRGILRVSAARWVPRQGSLRSFKEGDASITEGTSAQLASAFVFSRGVRIDIPSCGVWYLWTWNSDWSAAKAILDALVEAGVNLRSGTCRKSFMASRADRTVRR